MELKMKIKRIVVNNLAFFEDFIVDNDLTIIIETRKNPYGVKYLLAYIEGTDVVVRYTPDLLGMALKNQEKYLLTLLRDKISGTIIKGMQVPTLRKT